MAEEIKHDDLIEKKVFDPAIKDAKKLLKEIKLLEEGMIDLLKVSKDFLETNKTPTNTKEIKATSQAIATIAKAEKGLNKIRQEKLRLEKQLHDANSDSIQDNEELKIQLQEQRKSNKELARDKLGLIGVYQKESKRLIKLRKEYKDLVLVQGKETKETKKLRKEIQRLDKDLKEVDESAGQFQRNVGNYPETFSSATKSIIATSLAAVGLSASFDGLTNAAGGSVQGSENLRKVSAAVSGGIQQGANVVASATVDLFNFGKALLEGEKSLSDIGDAWKETGEATDNFAGKVQKSGEQGVAIAKAMIDAEKAARPLEEAVSRLNKVIAEQGLIAGDGTRSFKEIAEAALLAQEAQVKRSSILIRLAKEELEIADAQVEQADAAGGANVDLLDQQTRAVIKLQEARNEAAIEELETEQILRQLKQDKLERDLDILIDGYDNQKTINERIITNERKTFKERQDLLDETTRLANESFESQKEVLADLSGAGINVDELLNLDATELNKRIRELEQSEIIEGRTLEVVRERRVVLQDLADAQKDLTQSQIEAFSELSQVQQQGTIDAEEDFFKQLKLREAAILSQADNEVTIAGESAEQIKIIRATMNNDLAALDRERLKEEKRIADELAAEEKKRRDEELEARRQLLNDIANETLNQLSTINDAKLSAADAEISRLESSIETQQRIAAEGGKNILAEETARLAKARLEREREAKRQAQQEQAIALALAFVNSYASYSKEEPKGALNKALRDTFLAKGIAKLLTGFHDGGYTGDGNEHDVAGAVHKKEFVITAERTAQLGLKGANMSDFDRKMEAGALFGTPNEVRVSSGSNDTKILQRLENQTNRLEKAFKAGQSTYSVNWNSYNERVETIRKGNLTKLYRTPLGRKL